MFREFLLVKMINAEKATFQTPIFSKKRERTLDMLIKDLYDDYMGDSKLVSCIYIILTKSKFIDRKTMSKELTCRASYKYMVFMIILSLFTGSI